MYGASAAFFFFAFFFSLFFLFVLEARDVLRQLHLEQLRREKEKKKRNWKKERQETQKWYLRARFALSCFTLFFFFSVFWLVCKLAYAHRNFV